VNRFGAGRMPGGGIGAAMAGAGLRDQARPGPGRAGIGKVGNTGDARGGATHMHYGISWPTAHGIWWVRRGELYPWPYLDAWRAGVMRSPGVAVRALHRKLGDHGCTVDC
jgi:hypothetical protein